MGRLATGWLGCLIGLALTAWSQEAGVGAPTTPAGTPTAPASAPAATPRPAASRLDAGTLFHMARQMDADGNLLVDEKELTDGFAKFALDAEAVRADLLTWLDKDKDGKLCMDEWRPFFKAMWMLNPIRGVDRNNDLVLEESEVGAARAQMAEFCRAANDRTLRQFDLDHDGKLNEAEVQAARRAMRRFTPHGPGNGGTRSGADGGAGGGAVPEGTAAPTAGGAASPPANGQP